MPSRNRSEDADRLPEGVVRVGYDSDMQCYMFRDRDGVNYRGQPGMEFGGILTAISTPSTMGEDRRPTTTNDSSFEKTRPGAFADDKLDMGGANPTTTTDTPRRIEMSPAGPGFSTFGEILSPAMITTSSLSNGEVKKKKTHRRGLSGSSTTSTSSAPSAMTNTTPSRLSGDGRYSEEPAAYGNGGGRRPKEAFVQAARKASSRPGLQLPKMQGIVQSLTRSVTSFTRSRKGSARNGDGHGKGSGSFGRREGYGELVEEDEDEEAGRGLVASDSLSGSGDLHRSQTMSTEKTSSTVQAPARRVRYE